MKHITFGDSDKYPVAILIKSTYLRQYDLERHYLDRITDVIPAKHIVAMDLEYTSAGKAPVKLIKEYLAQLLPALDNLSTKYIYCADAAYFKALTKQTKAEPHIGYVLPCKVEGFEHMQVIMGMNYGQLVYNPELYTRLDLTLHTLTTAYQGNYQALGQNIIHSAQYPFMAADIAKALNQLHQYPVLSADIEAFSLHPHKAGVGTIGFAWDHHNGLAFAVDYQALTEPDGKHYGRQVPNRNIRHLLKTFFEQYKGKLRWHNAAYDLRTLIATLWMRNPLDWKGMIEGMEVMCRLFDDTKIITYLATNSTAGNSLGLKDQAHEFAGNYAQDEIKDIRLIPLSSLLEYNVVDCLATNYVFDKHYPTMVADNQETIYHEIMLPSIKTIIQMELVGMPLDPDEVQVAKAKLKKEEDSYLAVFHNNPIIAAFEKGQTQRAWEKDYEDRKAKAKNPDKILPKDRDAFPLQCFNPNSGPQLQTLLYEQLGLPIIDLTDTKQPATGGDTLEKLKNHAQDKAVEELLDALIALTSVSKILTSFIPSFEEAMAKDDGLVYLHGNFNLGGTVSGRLSSSKPNLQQIPSNSVHAKTIKKCFKAPKGWLFCGADFNSLEDYISALTTKDPNKLKVYTEGYDGHCLRAFWYFPDRLPSVVNTVESINGIKKKFPEIRQLSKTPTFALTYQGTYITLMKNLGFDHATAKKIEKAYHDLYRVSDEWVQAKMDQAAKDGFVDVAFGLRVRTPLLAQVLRGHRKTPYQAEAEARTAGNALGQSYGLLNNRAANAFMQKVWASEYCYDILPIAQIHDAIYLLIRDDVDVVEFVNTHLIKEMQWQDLPEIRHDEVKLGAELDIFWPSWADPLTLPNGSTEEEIRALCVDFQSQFKEQQKEAA